MKIAGCKWQAADYFAIRHSQLAIFKSEAEINIPGAGVKELCQIDSVSPVSGTFVPGVHQRGDLKPKLILIGGEAWTGKSTCAKRLYTRLYNSAWLDGDDVWRVNPWSVDDPRLRTSDINMAFVVQTYLQSRFDYVILSSIVLSEPSITASILERIGGVEYDLLSFTLLCDEATLTERAKQRDGNANPSFIVLERTRALADTFKIDSARKNPDEVVDEMLAVILGA